MAVEIINFKVTRVVPGSETSKWGHLMRSRGDYEKYLHRQGIDIGCGRLVLEVPNGSVMGWDTPQGDANVMKGAPDESFDFVYSSHCLEHMRSVQGALAAWVRILKPGGALYVAVPDFELFEQRQWPSRKNGDHKFSFSTNIAREALGRDNHYHIENDVVPVLTSLGVQTREIRLLRGEDYTIMFIGVKLTGKENAQA